MRRDVVEERDEERPLPDALARGKAEHQRVLDREIRAIAERIEELEHDLETASEDEKPDRQREVEQARAWRRLLVGDRDVVRGATPAAWRSVKRRVARHLEDDRPACFPTWAEKSFGI